MDKVPYMQRGGAWDNSDLASKNLKKRVQQKAAANSKVIITDKVSKKIVPKQWSNTDKAYANVRSFAPMQFAVEIITSSSVLFI